MSSVVISNLSSLTIAAGRIQFVDSWALVFVGIITSALLASLFAYGQHSHAPPHVRKAAVKEAFINTLIVASVISGGLSLLFTFGGR